MLANRPLARPEAQIGDNTVRQEASKCNFWMGITGKSTLAIILTLLSSSLALGQSAEDIVLPELIPTEEFAQRFTRMEVSSEGGEYEAFLSEPPKRNANKRYPLIVWLHGSGLIEFDEEFGPLKWIRELILRDGMRAEEQQFFILVPKLTRDNGRWFLLPPGEADTTDMLAIGERFINKAIKEYPIDEDRISVIGISSGGSAAWELAMRRPGMFSAVVPVSGACHSLDRIERLLNVPVWTFANEQDLPVAISVRKAVTALQEAGGIAHLTEFAEEGHDAWTDAFLGDYELVPWLLSKRKGDPAWYQPPGGRISIWFWSLLASIAPPILGIVVLYALCKAAIQSSRKKASAVVAQSAEIRESTPEGEQLVTESPTRLVIVRQLVLVFAVISIVLGVLIYVLIAWLSRPSITVIH